MFTGIAHYGLAQGEFASRDPFRDTDFLLLGNSWYEHGGGYQYCSCCCYTARWNSVNLSHCIIVWLLRLCLQRVGHHFSGRKEEPHSPPPSLSRPPSLSCSFLLSFFCLPPSFFQLVLKMLTGICFQSGKMGARAAPQCSCTICRKSWGSWGWGRTCYPTRSPT